MGGNIIQDGIEYTRAFASPDKIDVEFINNTGLPGALTALVLTDGFGTTIVSHSIFHDNFEFTVGLSVAAFLWHAYVISHRNLLPLL